MKYSFQFNLNQYTSPYIGFTVILGVGMIGIVLNAFWYDLCKLAIFSVLKILIVNFGQYLSVYALDGKIDRANKYEMLILGR